MTYGTINVDKVVSSDGTTAGGLYGFKNRIINGAMVIDQRNAGASVSYSTSGAVYCVDRWYGQGVNSAGVFTLQQSTDAPTGFSSSIKATVTTSSTPGSNQVYRFIQRIEGYNLADLSLGTSGASSFTISFWVKSSVTGTFGGSLWGAGATRWYIFSYTINSADTWEYKTVVVSPVTSGSFATTSSNGLQLTFNLGAGSGLLGDPGSWISNAGSPEYYGPTGQTNLIATNGATMYITGVQLEKGSTATSFDYRPYGTELQLCQRYYEKSYSVDVAPGTATGNGAADVTVTSNGSNLATYQVMYSVQKRTTPTITGYRTTGTSGQWSYERSGVSSTGQSVSAGGISASTAYMAVNVGLSWAACEIYGHWVASAEL